MLVFPDLEGGILLSIDGLNIAETTAVTVSDLLTAAEVPFETFGMVIPGFFLSSLESSLVMIPTSTDRTLLAVLELPADAASFKAFLHAKYECPSCVPGGRGTAGFWLAVLDGGC